MSAALMRSGSAVAGSSSCRRAAIAPGAQAPLRGVQQRTATTMVPRHLSSTSCPSSVVVARPRGGVACRGLFGLGLPELAVIAGVTALIFGPSKLPELGKGLGKTVKSFQSAAKEFETELKAAASDDEAAGAGADKQQQQQQQQEGGKDGKEAKQ